nr:hypothetical protein [Streptococcus pneumoniae]
MIHRTTIPYFVSQEVYWKVRNIEAEAIRRNCERGAIFSGKNKISRRFTV